MIASFRDILSRQASLILKWDESKVKRGKTTPASNKGSFAPGKFSSSKYTTSTGKEQETVTRMSKVGVTRGKDGILRFDGTKTAVPKDMQEGFDRIAITRSTGDKRLKGMRLNANRNAGLQVIGYNIRGKLTYHYSAKIIGKRAAAKHARARGFDKVISKFEAHVKKNLNNTNQRTRQAAEISYLIAVTGMRPGNSRGKLGAKQAYGATTLEARHVSFSGSKATLKFVGKKGVQQNITVDDKLAVSILKRATTRAKTPKDQIFPAADEQATLAYVKAATGNPRYLVKDMRTWAGTAEAKKYMSTMKSYPQNPTQLKKYKMDVATHVSKKLGNEPSTTLKAYIDPLVWEDWEGRMP